MTEGKIPSEPVFDDVFNVIKSFLKIEKNCHYVIQVDPRLFKHGDVVDQLGKILTQKFPLSYFTIIPPFAIIGKGAPGGMTT